MYDNEPFELTMGVNVDTIVEEGEGKNEIRESQKSVASS